MSVNSVAGEERSQSEHTHKVIGQAEGSSTVNFVLSYGPPLAGREGAEEPGRGEGGVRRAGGRAVGRAVGGAGGPPNQPNQHHHTLFN